MPVIVPELVQRVTVVPVAYPATPAVQKPPVTLPLLLHSVTGFSAVPVMPPAY